MSATIKASCPHCGDVSLTPDEVLLELLAPTASERARGDTYAFTCPDCAQEVRKPADERIVQLLRSGGVPVRQVEPYPERLPDIAGPLTRDHLLELHQELQSEDWLDQLLASGPR